MALPLLALAGTALWGGAQFLESRRDEREAESLLTTFQPQAQGLDAADVNARYERAAGQLQAQSGHFLNPNKEAKALSLIDQYNAEMQEREAAEKQRQLDYAASNEAALKDVRAQRQAGAVRHAGVQGAMRNAEEFLMGSKTFSQQDLYGIVYQFAEALAPDDRKTDEDIQNIIDTTPLLARMMNQLSKAGTSGTANETIGRQLYTAMQTLYRSEQKRFNVLEEQTQGLVDSYQAEGLDIDPARYNIYGVETGYTPRPITDRNNEWK